jgi:hypothetical protein
MTTIVNALSHYYSQLQASGEMCSTGAASQGPPADFVPDFKLPELSDPLRRFFAPSTIKILELGTYKGSDIRLLDLTCNPKTRTTKTFASYVMVARAVRHIQTTGESIMLVTPSSGNKGGALRDAVLQAIECGLVEPHQLRIAIVVPKGSAGKLWRSPLSADPELRALNPVLIAEAGGGSEVKRLTKSFVQDHSSSLWRDQRLRIWHTYQLDNYRMADAVRAFVEAEWMGCPQPGRTRIHAQAVSSAFGLLGYDHGRRVVEDMPGATSFPPSEWLLVQHLGTPDLVLNKLFGSCSRENLPRYDFDGPNGLHVQSQHAAFPGKTWALDEIIDTTFYSNNPITADLVKAAQEQHGGAGIVVSLQECLERYGYIRSRLPAGGPSLPADPRDMREWALVMALTGVYCALDRGLVSAGSEVIVHASGSYSVADYATIPFEDMISVSDTMDLLAAVLGDRRPGGGARKDHGGSSVEMLQPVVSGAPT